MSNSSLCLSGAAPVSLTQTNNCNLGFFRKKICEDMTAASGPNNTVERPPQYRYPTVACQITRLEALFNTCPSSYGLYESARWHS